MYPPDDALAGRLKLSATLESLDPFQDFVRGQIRESGCPRETQFKIQLALEEALVNIIHYAYSPGSAGWIELACRLEPGGKRLCVEIRDGGRAFNPFERGQPDVTLPLDKRQIGGLGIFLVRQMTEKAEYRRDGDTNVMTLEFDL